MKALHMDEAYAERPSIEPTAVFEFVCFDRDYSGSTQLPASRARGMPGPCAAPDLGAVKTLNSTWLDTRVAAAPRRSSGRASSMGKGTLAPDAWRHHRHHDAR